MFRSLFVTALLCANLFHTDASSLRRLRNDDGDEISRKYLNLASEASRVDIIQQQHARRMPANPVVEEDESIAELSMSVGAGLSMSYGMSMSMSYGMSMSMSDGMSMSMSDGMSMSM